MVEQTTGRNAHKRESFGTPYVDPYTPKQLFEISLSLIPKLFAIDLRNNTINAADYNDIMRLLEIVAFGEEKYPYLLTIHVDRSRITEIKLWKDPHYQHLDDEECDGISSSMCLPIDFILDFSELSQKPEILPKKIHRFTDPALVSGDTEANLCFAGTSDGRFVLGKPDPVFFQGKEPVFSILAPVED
jgi:hypothetical protein